jgi:hypothetical protein
VKYSNNPNFEHRYNYKHIPIRDEDWVHTQGKVEKTYKRVKEFDYEKLVNEGLVNKHVDRVMYTTCIMVDGSKYNGQFRKHSMTKDGIGHIIYPDGSLFEGVFKNDDTVKGRYIFTNGYIYQGDMKNHKMHGNGVLKYKNKIIYSGEFENGEQCSEKLTLVSTMDSAILNPTESNQLQAMKSVQFDL